MGKKKGWLAKQIKDAQHTISQWPIWMRKAARFEGDHPTKQKRNK